MMTMRRRFWFLVSGFWLLNCSLIPFSLSANAQTEIEPQEEFMRATVVAIDNEEREAAYEGLDRIVQTVRLRIVSGEDTGTEFTTENGIINDRDDMRLSEGETVVVRKLTKVDGETEYLIQEKYRLRSMTMLALFFLMLAFVFGGVTGVTSLFGLAMSILVLIFFVVPKMIAGWDPLVVSLIGSYIIACTSLYLAHGFNRRTSIALLSTVSILTLSALMAVAFVRIGKLFGMGTEESIYLQVGQLETLNLRGLLLGGIIIGTLGVLDDITTAQTAAVEEIYKANPAMPLRQLLAAGRSVGREHIASLINTLALAYVGASLPLLLLFQTNGGVPLWVILNSEYLGEEIVRTLVGSSALVLAVPISTYIAARLIHGRPVAGLGETMGHHHHH